MHIGYRISGPENIVIVHQTRTYTQKSTQTRIDRYNYQHQFCYMLIVVDFPYRRIIHSRFFPNLIVVTAAD
jgi:hypothetical protein